MKIKLTAMKFKYLRVFHLRIKWEISNGSWSSHNLEVLHQLKECVEEVKCSCVSCKISGDLFEIELLASPVSIIELLSEARLANGAQEFRVLLVNPGFVEGVGDDSGKGLNDRKS